MASSGSSVSSVSPGTSHSWVGLSNVVRSAMSQEIRLQVQPLLRFKAFAKHKTELGVQPGKTIDMVAFGNLSLGGALSEGVHMETKAMSTSLMSVNVAEHGNAVAMTEFLVRSSMADLITTGSQLLAQDAAKVIDLICRRALDAGTLATIFGGTATARNHASFTDASGAARLNMSDIRDAAATLSSNKVPKFVGMGGRECYICFVHPNVVRHLKDDTNWKSASEYAGAEQIFRGEVGRFDDVVFIETTMCPIIKKDDTVLVDGAVISGETDTTSGASSVNAVHKSYMIGGDSLGFAEALPIEIREDGIKDYGRERALAWYGIFGAKTLDFGSQIKVVRLESTSSLQLT